MNTRSLLLLRPALALILLFLAAGALLLQSGQPLQAQEPPTGQQGGGESVSITGITGPLQVDQNHTFQVEASGLDTRLEYRLAIRVPFGGEVVGFGADDWENPPRGQANAQPDDCTIWMTGSSTFHSKTSHTWNVTLYACETEDVTLTARLIEVLDDEEDDEVIATTTKDISVADTPGVIVLPNFQGRDQTDRKLTPRWTAPSDNNSDITRYDVWYILNSATDRSDSNWTQRRGGSGISHYDITGLTNGTKYDVRVRACNALGCGVWSNTITGTPGRKPFRVVIGTTSSSVNSITVNWSAPSNGGYTITGYTVEYAVGNGSFTEASFSGTGTSITIRGLSPHTSYRVRICGTNGKGHGDWSIIKTITTLNSLPEFPSTTVSRSIPENTAANRSIGSPVSATDPDGDSLTYSLSGTDRTSFSIVSSSGQLRTSAALDHETKDSYSVTVTARDGFGGSDSTDVTITVTDVNEAPTITGVSDPHNRNHAENGTGTVFDYNASDPEGNSITWSLSGGADRDFFSINSSGELQFASAPDFENARDANTNNVYIVNVRASDGSLHDTVEVQVTVTNVNEAPTITGVADPHNRNHAENGTGTVFDYDATDPEGSTLTWSLPAGADRDFFSINSSGELQFASAPDFENARDANTNNVYIVNVRASDGSLHDTVEVWVTVTDEDEAPKTPGAPTVEAASTDGHTMLTVTWTAPENTGPAVTDYDVQYRAGSSGSFTDASFTGDGLSTTIGSLSPSTTYQVQVRATNAEGTSAWSAAGEGTTGAAPTNPPTFSADNATRSIAENTTAGVNIGDAVTATDPDNDTLTYTLGGTDAASFDIVAASGQLQTKAALDYENKTSYSVTITASDRNGGSDSITVTVNVTNVDEPGTIALAPDEPTAGSALTATLTDPDGSISGATWSWEHSSDQTSWSTISGATAGSYTPVAADVGSYLRATASYTDGQGSGKSAQAATTNSVQAGNKEPKFPASENGMRSIAENTAAGVNIGAPVATSDPDNDTLTYSLGGTDAASFGIDADNGQLKTKAALDHEAKSSYSVEVSVRDSKDAAGSPDTTTDDMITVTITVANVDEPGAVKLSSDQPTAGSALTATLTDPDGSIAGVTWSWERSSDQASWTTISGASAASYTPVAADVGSHLRATASYTDGHGAGKSAQAASANATQAAAAVNPAPAFPDSETGMRSVAENTAADVDIGAPVAASDPDNDTLTYSLGGTDAASFDIVAASGQLQTKAALDYENKRSYSVTVSVRDSEDDDGNPDTAIDDSIDVTISVTDQGGPATPAAPSVAPSATSGYSSLNVSWAPPAGADAPVTDYDVQYREGSSGAFTDADFNGVTTSTVITGLKHNTRYEVQVRAVNAEGASPWSDSGEGTTALLPLPARVTGFVATPGNTQVWLRWDNPGNPSITKFQYWIRIGAGSWQWHDIPESDASTTSYRLTGLTNGVDYRFRVRAVNARGASQQSLPQRVSPTAASPAQPTGVTAVPGDGEVTLRWDDPLDASITKHQYNQQVDGSWGAWQDIPNSADGEDNVASYTLGSLTNGTAHTFAVRAVNATGNGPASDAVSATPTLRPPKPTGLAATPGDGQVTLKWDEPSYTSITKHQYNIRIDGNWGAWRDIPDSAPGEANDTSYTLEDLTNGTAHTFAIRAANANGNGSASDQVTATPAPPTKPSKPTGLAAGAGNTQITLSWDDPANPSITKYQYTTDSGVNWTDIPNSAHGEANATSYTVGSLTNGVTYTFAIRAVNAIGESPTSDSVTATPTYPPGAPTGLTATPGNGQVTLSWDDPLDGTITKYQLRQKEAGSSFGDWTDVAGSGSSTTSHTVESLTNGVTYTFTVRAVNASGNSNSSSEVTATPSANQGSEGKAGAPATGYPAKPAGLTATPGDGQVTLRWDNPNDAAITRYQYNVQCGGSWGAWTDIPGSGAGTTTHMVTGLPNGAECSFAVRAISANGNGPPSDTTSATPARR